MKMFEAMTSEMQREAAITRRVLERVPADKLSWKPHPKSMSLGQLALHIATLPGRLSRLAQMDEFDIPAANFDPPDPHSTEEILGAHDVSVKTAREYLSSISEPAALGDWRLTFSGKEVFTISRAELLRTMMLNHWYHHRGQISVYLRLLEVSVPAIYGRSADENPFA
jgi:uncharacterized damage-inducible protein DinB